MGEVYPPSRPITQQDNTPKRMGAMPFPLTCLAAFPNAIKRGG